MARGRKLSHLSEPNARQLRATTAKELDALVRFVRQLDEVVDPNGELRDEPEPTTN